jgi:hypothetical protein
VHGNPGEGRQVSDERTHGTVQTQVVKGTGAQGSGDAPHLVEAGASGLLQEPKVRLACRPDVIADASQAEQDRGQ